jgi:molybdopterin-containing oxidoreductase family iron-sulfur binding subunit
MRRITRRDLLKVMGATGTTVLLSTSGATASKIAKAVGGYDDGSKGRHPDHVYYAPPPDPNAQWGMVIDTNLCMGCGTCREACAKENNIGENSGFRYIKILTMEKGEINVEHTRARPRNGEETWNMPVQCMQCENPPCTNACPITATWRERDGIIVVDYKKCMGCRYCIMNCPYWARHFNWEKPSANKVDGGNEDYEGTQYDPPRDRPAGVVEKCTFCIHRVRLGKVTRCTEACPRKARVFGNINDPNSTISRVLKERQAFRLKEELGTNPRIWYLG